MQRRILAAGALLAVLGVGLGAFGAHALREALGQRELGWWQTGVHYQMWHAVALLALSAVPLPRVGAPSFLLGLGAAVFSATLYLMALGAPRWLGAVTPVGGALMILGWLLLAWRASSHAGPPSSSK